MLTAAELKRLMELMGKDANSLTEAETTELKALKAKADAAKDDTKSADGLTEADLKSLIATELAKAGDKGLTEAQVKGIVENATKGLKAEVDSAKIVADVTEQVKGLIKPGLTSNEVEALFEKSLGNIRKESRMQHDDGKGFDPSIEIPIGHRAGNLDIGQKQLLNIMTGKGMNEGISESQLTLCSERSSRAEKSFINGLRTKGITTTGAGSGAEWMGTSMSTTLLQRMYLESQLAQAFLASEVAMPTDPYEYPLSTTRPQFTMGAEDEDISETGIGTGELVLKTGKLVGKVPYTYEAEEDTLIPILPNIVAQLSAAAAEALENAIINGDKAGTLDSDFSAKDQRKLFDGIRKLTLAQARLKVSLATGGLSKASGADNIMAIKMAMKKYGLNPKNCFILAGVTGYNRLVMLNETLTAEKTGNASTARILTGQAPNLLGMDIVPSAFMREDLNATGTYDGTTTTKGSVLIVHRPSWIMGTRRGFLLETDVNKHSQKKWVIASFRRDFKPVESLASINAAAIGYGYDA